MRIFISSVTYLLKDERNALPRFLRLLGHEPLRFEDFAASDRSSREVCLAGVDAADVYVLLLGPRYGDTLPDSGLAPTEEEFRFARTRGIPILVFNKLTDESEEPAQQRFKEEVGHYVNGRFWRSFTDPLTLNEAVGEALKQLPVVADARMTPLSTAVGVPWLGDSAGLGGRGMAVAPVLEVHVVPLDTGRFYGATALSALSKNLVIDGRAAGFFADSDAVDVGSDNARAWAIRRPGMTGGWGSRRTEQDCGLVADRSGAVGGFVSLPTDFAGALVDKQCLQRDIARLVALAAPRVEAAEAAVAVSLTGAERVAEGDPALVGVRTNAHLNMQQGVTIRVGGDFAVSTCALVTAMGDVVAELAAAVLNDVRALR